MAGEGKRIVLRRVKADDEHGHGNTAWKIAFADFMTAMLALFIVLWALGTDQETRQGIESYFTDPVGSRKAYSGGASPVSAGTSPAQVKTVPLEALIRQQMKAMEEVGERIRERLNGDASLGKIRTQVEIVVTREGLRIELLEAGGGETFFPFGSAQMKPVTRAALAAIAPELAGLSNPVIVEGHTDSAPFRAANGYSNWELSSDRAHAARRVMEAYGLGYTRIKEVRGYADKYPRVAEQPLDPSNRRITILLPLQLGEGAEGIRGEPARSY
jgi:chemotaxis protein MotB